MVRRFDVYCNGGWDGCTTYEDDDERGDYVSYSDYAALERRLVELQEAVRWERECSRASISRAVLYARPWAIGEFIITERAARAAVDALGGGRMTQKWLTLAQACAYTGRSAWTLKRKAQEDLIIGHRPEGSQWQFDRESIDAFFTPPVSKAAFDIVRSLRK